MKAIKKTANFELLAGSVGDYPIYYIESSRHKLSKPFTKEVADSLCSMDSDYFDNECAELMNVENFHIEREWQQAD